MKASRYETRSIDHLGLVAGLCQELKIADYIDNKMPKQPAMTHVTHGQLLVAMILNGLGFVSRTLHMFPQYFEDKPVERLLGAKIKAEHINDDALGRCLDTFYDFGVSPLYQELAESVVQYLGLPCESTHLDATSFHVDGKYDDLDAQGIRLTKGYSRDHRPDLNQVILNLITENQAGLPVYMQACSGNTNDVENFKKLVKSHVASLKAAQRSRYFIGDAALYVAETIQALEQQKQRFITRVPQKLIEAKVLLKSAHATELTAMENGYSGAWFDSDYAGVKQKWLLVKSMQAEKREHHTLKKAILKSTEQSCQTFKKLCKKKFACETDAKRALDEWEKTQTYIRVAASSIFSEQTHATRGRPKKNAEGKATYWISGQLYSSLERKEAADATTGFFILATNDCTSTLSMQAMLAHYKSQQAVEKGFRFLKSPDFLVSSLFLKKPERIEALLMVMTCCLMIYAALEHLIRRQLLAMALFFPDMKKKPTQKPTARWVFSCFQGVHELIIDSTTKTIVNLKERQETILNCLGDIYWKIYS